MYKRALRSLRKRFGRRHLDIDPEDIFMDATNLPGFEEHRLEGRIEQPMSERTFILVKVALVILLLALTSKLWMLGVHQGQTYTQISESNRLEQTTIFANRGVIYDRNLKELATNVLKDGNDDFAGRHYATSS